MQEDFTNVKVGDILVLSRWNMPDELVSVIKVTPKRFDAGTYTWNKDDGSVIGFSGSYWRPTIYVPKEEDIARIQQDTFVRNVYHKLSKLQLNDLTYEKAVLIDEIL